MTTQDRIKAHTRAIEILEAIRSFESTISVVEEDLPFLGQKFPALVPSSRHQIEICQAAIERLEKMYQKAMREMGSCG
jgi:hypothetical protein